MASDSLVQHRKTGIHAGICLGHRSALEIARGICPSDFTTTKAKNRRLPERAPGKENVERTLALVEDEYPNLNLTRPVHVLVGSDAQCRYSDVCVSHSCQVELSDGAVRRLDVPGADVIFVSSPPFAFAQMAAQEKSLLSLIQLGFEICGTYRTGDTSTDPAYQVQPLTCTQALRDFVMRNPSIWGTRKVRRALPYIADGSASPRESKLALLLGLPKAYGGFGLGMPHMNYRVDTDRRAKAVTGKSYLLCDLCWPEAKLDVEYQSHEMHANENSRIKDSRRTNALDSMGWKIVNITNNELDSMSATDAIADTIRKHLGKRRRLNTPDHYSRRKFDLRRRLGLVIGYE